MNIPLDVPLNHALAEVLAAIWGALWGSFMNVCITRISANESVVRPRSHCRSCKAQIRWYDNIPIVSYIVLRGRCRSCQARFSLRYLVVETLSAGAAVLLWHLLAHHSERSLASLVAAWLGHFAFVGTLIVISFIDLDTYRIPNVITYPAIPLFTALSFAFAPTNFWDGPIGAIVGYLSLRLLSDGYFWLTGREGLGYGDAKLLALTGGFLGWQSLLPTLFSGSVMGSIVGITFVAMRRKPGTTESLRFAKIPFGPFLAIGALVYLFYGDVLARFTSWMLGAAS